MAITEKKIAVAAMPTSPTVDTIYTVPASTRAIIKTFDIVNTAATSRSATVYFVPAAGSPGASNAIIPGLSLFGNEILQWTGLQILEAGDTIQVMGSASGVTIHISGAESTYT